MSHKLRPGLYTLVDLMFGLFSYICSTVRMICHGTDGPPTNGPAGPSTANFVAINGPAGPSMAAMDGLAGLTTVP